MSDTERTLAGIALFSGPEAEQLDGLDKLCTWRQFDADQEVVGLNEPSSTIYFVITGSVRANVYTAIGKQISFRDIDTGQFFGELAAIDGQSRSASIVAMEQSLIASMPADAFRGALEKYGAAATAMLVHMAGQIRALSARVVEFSSMAVSNRIQAELLRLVRQKAPEGNEVTISDPPTHAEIASRVATHREAVTREMNYLDREGSSNATPAGSSFATLSAWQRWSRRSGEGPEPRKIISSQACQKSDSVGKLTLTAPHARTNARRKPRIPPVLRWV